MIMRTTICVLVLLGIASVASAKSAEAGDGPLAERASSSRGKAASELHEGIATKAPTFDVNGVAVGGDAPIKWVNVPSHYMGPTAVAAPTPAPTPNACLGDGSGTDETCTCPSCHSGPHKGAEVVTKVDSRRRRRGPVFYTYGHKRYCSKIAATNGSWSGYGNWGGWGGWSGWGACNGNGNRYRYRYRYSYRSCAGASCGGANTVGASYCPGGTGRSQASSSRSRHHQVHCAQSAWSAWSTCTKSCGSGSQKRTRSTTTAASCGGNACAHAAETQACGDGPCPIHCATSAFSAWTVCTKSCGQGAQSRSRTVTTRNLHGGYVCPYLAETRNCNQQACAVDGGWSAFGSCDQFCGSGSQSRTCTSPVPAHGGASCPGSATGACNTAACPKAPKCFVTASGETIVEYTDTMTPSFKCTHTAIKCKCTASGHPTHHKGGCQQIDGTSGKTQSLAGDCTSTGKNNPATTGGGLGAAPAPAGRRARRQLA